MAVTDMLAIVLGFAIASFLYEGAWFEPRAMMQAYLMLTIFGVIAWHNDSWSFSALAQWPSAVMRMGVALLLAAALLNLIAFYLKANSDFSRGTFTIAVLLAGTIMAAVRPLFAKMAHDRFGPSLMATLVIEAGGAAVPDAEGERLNTVAFGFAPRLDDPESLHKLALATENMERVIVSCPHGQRFEWATALKALGVRAEIVDQNITEVGALEIGEYAHGQTPTLVVSTGPLGMRARMSKRLFDILFAGVALVLTLPLMAVIAVAIRLDDGGSILFRQRRTGKRNEHFTIYKFRTLCEAYVDFDGAVAVAPADRRATVIGNILRRTSLDELPQLFNVLRGEMSIVGPRPHALGSHAGEKLFWEVDSAYWTRHALKPGMTGLAQIRGLRGATDTENDLRKRLQADLEYSANWSLARDIGILLGTFRVLIHERAF